MQGDGWLAPPSDLNLSPGEVHTGSERLPNGLLRRKAPCVALCGPWLAIEFRYLSWGEAARTEAFWVSQQRAFHSLNLDQVESDE